MGIPSINNKVREINFLGSRVDLSEGSIDAQKSEDTNILIVVNGDIALPGKSVRPFVQTFLLAGQGGGTSFYCRNSIMRLLPAPAPVVVQAPAPVAAPIIPQFQSAAPVPVAAPAPAPVAALATDLHKLTVEPARAPAPAPAPAPVPEPVEEAPKGPQSWADRLKSAAATEAPAKPAAGAIKVVKSAPKPAPAAAKPAEGSSSNGKPKDNGASAKPAVKASPAIYVRNIAADATKEEVQATFASFGPNAVKRVDIVAEKGIAFLDLDSEETLKAILAHAAATPFEFKGVALKVEERKPVQPKKTDSKPAGNGRDGGKPRGDKPAGDKPRGDKSGSRPPRASKPAQD